VVPFPERGELTYDVAAGGRDDPLRVREQRPGRVHVQVRHTGRQRVRADRRHQSEPGACALQLGDLPRVRDELGGLRGWAGVHDQPASGGCRRGGGVRLGQLQRGERGGHRPEVVLVLAGHRFDQDGLGEAERVRGQQRPVRLPAQQAGQVDDADARRDDPRAQLAGQPGGEGVHDQLGGAQLGQYRLEPPAELLSAESGRRGLYPATADHTRVGGERRAGQDRDGLLPRRPGVQVRADPGEVAQPAAVGIADDHRPASRMGHTARMSRMSRAGRAGRAGRRLTRSPGGR